MKSMSSNLFVVVFFVAGLFCTLVSLAWGTSWSCPLESPPPCSSSNNSMSCWGHCRPATCSGENKQYTDVKVHYLRSGGEFSSYDDQSVLCYNRRDCEEQDPDEGKVCGGDDDNSCDLLGRCYCATSVEQPNNWCGWCDASALVIVDPASWKTDYICN